MTTEEKISELKKLKKEMLIDKTLPLRSRDSQLVFGEGNPDSLIYFIGEAPGFHENRLGRPFVGQAGKLLDKLIVSIGLERKKVYISNIVRFRPPENRDPLPSEIEAFEPYVDREIEIIDPPIIVTLGRFSMGKFLPFEKISGIHGRERSIIWKGKEKIVIPMYHPAAALRAGSIMRQLEQDFQQIKKVANDLENKRRIEEQERRKPSQLGLLDK